MMVAEAVVLFLSRFVTPFRSSATVFAAKNWEAILNSWQPAHLVPDHPLLSLELLLPFAGLWPPQ